MVTPVTKTIGSAAGRNYTTIKGFCDALPASLVTADQQWTGEFYQDTAGAEFTGPNSFTTVGTQRKVTDATHYVVFKAGAGQSFTDNASKLTNALRYNASNGVGFAFNYAYAGAFVADSDYTQIIGIQFRSANASTVAVATSDNTIFDQCILSGSGDSGGFNVGVISLGGTSKARNSLIIATGATGVAARINTASLSLESCTLISPSGVSNTGGALFGFYASPCIQNVAIFGFGSILDNSGRVGTTTTLTAGSDYNATNLSTTPANWGSHSLTGLTFASQFKATSSAASLDARAASGNGLQHGTAGPTIDIVGQARAAPSTIGAWEYVASSTSKAASPASLVSSTLLTGPSISRSRSASPAALTTATSLTQAAVSRRRPASPSGLISPTLATSATTVRTSAAAPLALASTTTEQTPGVSGRRTAGVASLAVPTTLTVPAASARRALTATGLASTSTVVPPIASGRRVAQAAALIASTLLGRPTAQSSTSVPVAALTAPAALIGPSLSRRRAVSPFGLASVGLLSQPASTAGRQSHPAALTTQPLLSVPGLSARRALIVRSLLSGTALSVPTTGGEIIVALGRMLYLGPDDTVALVPHDDTLLLVRPE